MPMNLIIWKVVGEASNSAPTPVAEIIASKKIAKTWPSTPDNAFLRPKLMPLLAARITEGPTLTDAAIEIVR